MNHCGTKTLETPRLILRRATQADAPALFEIFGDSQVVKFLRVAQYDSVAPGEEFLRAVVTRFYPKADYYYWLLEEKASGTVIGTIGLSSLNEADEVGEVGYALGRAHWRKGYMTEALKTVLLFALREVGYNRIEANHSVGNPASGAVMRSAGMLYEGMCREKYKNQLGYHDTHMYAILKSDLG